ncbi:MAG TPA: preQ(1) synthase [Tepidisphaeraceae bacterium]|jgi:7-cyano-7-deazaguanine reductase
MNHRKKRTPQSPAKFKQLGHKSILTDEQIDRPQTILEAFDNPRPGRDYEITFVFPEFTSVCPVTGQPDFATITVSYVPERLCVEMKSLKLYFFAYRNKGIFYEAVVNTILDDLVEALRPRRMTVLGEFAVRGGTAGTVTASYKGRRGGKSSPRRRKERREGNSET